MNTKITIASIVFLLIIVGMCFAATHSQTGLELDSDGWTDLSTLPQSSSRVVYVSTSGNDGNATDYNATWVSDIFDPSSTPNAHATLSSAYTRLRDGYPDIMLLKRGDDWSENMPVWTKSGESQTKRMLVSAYGSTTTARPIIDTFTTSYGVSNPENKFDYVAFISIEFSKFSRQIDGSYMLIEDCAIFEDATTGMQLQGYGNEDSMQYVTIRRIVIADRYPSGAHCQGLYAYNTDHLLLEESVFHHNGWSDQPSRTVYNHNTYLDVENSNTIFRYNISAEASNKGFQPGGGGYIYGNLSVQDPIGIESSRSEGGYTQGFSSTIKHNVILDGQDNKSVYAVYGIRFNNVSSSTTEDNIVGDCNATDPIAIYFEPNASGGDNMNVKNITFYNNIIHDWSGISLYFQDTYPRLENITITDNAVHNARDTDYLGYHTDSSAAQITSSGNTFYGIADSGSWFRYSGGDQSLTTWKTTVGDSTSDSGQTTPSGNYSIIDYLTHIGDTATMAAFYTKIEGQRKGNWDTDYMAHNIINFVRGKFSRGDITYSLTGSSGTGAATGGGTGSATGGGTGSMSAQ